MMILPSTKIFFPAHPYSDLCSIHMSKSDFLAPWGYQMPAPQSSCAAHGSTLKCQAHEAAAKKPIMYSVWVTDRSIYLFDN